MGIEQFLTSSRRGHNDANRDGYFLVFVSERHACYGPRDQEDSDVEMDFAMYTTLFFGWRIEARTGTGSRNPPQLTITRLLFHKLPLTLPRFSGPPSTLWPLAGHERDLPS